MAPNTKSLPSPRELGWALFRPFLLVIGGCAALLATLYLLVGLDPTTPVARFFVDYVEVTLPIAGRLTIAWVLYCIFYLLLGTLERDLPIVVLFFGQLAECWRRRVTLAWEGPRSIACSHLPLSLLRDRQELLPVWLAARWRAGDSIQQE